MLPLARPAKAKIDTIDLKNTPHKLEPTRPRKLMTNTNNNQNAIIFLY